MSDVDTGGPRWAAESRWTAEELNGATISEEAQSREAKSGQAESGEAEAERQGRLAGSKSPGATWADGLGVVAIRALQFLILLAAGAIVIWAALQVTIVVIPLLLAIIIASAMEPVLAFLGRHGWPRALSTVLVLLVVVLVFGGLIWVVVAQVMSQWGSLTDKVGQGIGELIAWWNSTFPQFELNDQALADLWVTAQEWIANLNYGALGSGVASGIGAFASFVTSLVLFVVILFFFLKDGPSIWSFLIRPLQGAYHRRAELMGLRAVNVMGGYVRGTVIVALVDAVFIGLGLVIIGVPLALPLALIVFICAFIPVVGATLAGVVAALVTLVTNGFWPAIAVAIIVVIVNQLEGNLLQPIVLGRSLQLHELVVLIALTTGTILGGIIGTLMSVPLTAVVWALIRAWNEPLPSLERGASDGNDSIRDRLREKWRSRTA